MTPSALRRLAALLDGPDPWPEPPPGTDEEETPPPPLSPELEARLLADIERATSCTGCGELLHGQVCGRLMLLVEAPRVRRHPKYPKERP